MERFVIEVVKRDGGRVVSAERREILAHGIADAWQRAFEVLGDTPRASATLRVRRLHE
ncbi:MAG TPA: hypothetical protein VMV18_04405 [bacterium]|nr:hypothetical protein [bacterium]